MGAGVDFLVGIKRQPGADHVAGTVLRYLHAVAHYTVQPHEMLVRILVVAEPAGLGIERHALA